MRYFRESSSKRYLGAIFSRVAVVFILFYSRVNTIKMYLAMKVRGNISIGSGCSFEKGVSVRATDGGKIIIGNNVAISQGALLVAKGGTIKIDNDTFIGCGSIIVARSGIFIGNDALIAEYVTIRDQDHKLSLYPYRLAGFDSSPINISNNVWIGAKASILRGSNIGESAVIGAHSLVNSAIPPFTISGGVPARVIRKVN